MRRTIAIALVLVGAALAAARTPPATLEFPKDHGSHADAAIEWWYWTGHLEGDAGQAYGFQLTFFRVRDVHLAHFAWSDLAAKRFTFDEKTHLGLPGIAGASESKLDVFNEDWSAKADGGTGKQSLHTRSGGAEITLTLAPLKEPVLHGDAGISRKGPGKDDYSHYVSITRLSVSGLRNVGGRRENLRGTAWFDHEWGPGGLPGDTVGWDWFALQLSDGSELMLYRMRTAAGSASPFSSGTYVPASGAPRHVDWKSVTLSPRTSWTSPHSKATYPAVWSLAVASLDLDVTLTPLLADQELSTEKSTGVVYWEGACGVSGRSGGRPVSGRAYVEMTGYAGRDVPGSAAALP